MGSAPALNPTPEIRALTGLRGAAALWVAAYHLLLPGHVVTGWPAAMLGRGHLAVDVFFLLSGFLLAMKYGARFAGPGRLAVLPGFLWRRLGRIFPLYGLILALRIGYTGWRYGSFALPRPWIAAPSGHPWIDVPANVLLVQSWHVAPSLIGPAWSVSTEWAAYWMFPLLAAILLHGRAWLAVAGGVCAGVAVAAAADGHGGLDAWDGQGWGALLRCLGGFALGMALWRLSRRPRAAGIAARPACAWGVIGLLAAGCAAAIPDLALYPLLPALVFCLAAGSRGPARLLARAGPAWLGEVSYALYLLHIFLLHPLDQARAAAALLLPAGVADAAAVAAILALLLAGSELAHRWVERPGRTWAMRLRARPFSLTRTSPTLRNPPSPTAQTVLRAADTTISRSMS